VTRAGSGSSATKANVTIAEDDLITLIDPSEDMRITGTFLAATEDDLIQLLDSLLPDDDISATYEYFPLTDVDNDIPLDVGHTHTARARVEDVDLLDKWLIDSGASQIMCSNCHWFHQFNPLPNHIMITLGDNSTIPTTGHGRILVRMNAGGHYKRIMLQDILYIPDMGGNLLSVSHFACRGAKMHFKGEGCKLLKDAPPTALAAHTSTATANLTTWHQRLGHLNAEDVTLMHTKGMVTGMEITKGTTLVTPCEPCLKGKQTRAEIRKSTDTQADVILGCIFSDVCGHMSPSHDNFIYFVTWIDDKS